MEQKFRKDGNQTREEFLAQFSDTTEEITVLIRHAWTKGSSRYNKIGNEEIVEVYYNLPWLGDEKNAFGTIYWLAKKKLLGYPYPPKFKERSYYRLKVRKCKSGENNYYLEEVLEKEIDIMKDDNIYFATLKKYLDAYREETKEVTVCCAEDLDISKTKNPVQQAIRRGVLDCSAILEEDGKIKPVSRCITVPFDDRHFSANKKLKFKAGKNYRL
ncbi:MAG: hypothetical protein J5825_01945 [Lachnospiraceae bacterium]|nr:hypothetical protein [Lachnospiraceae bacterium]